MNELTKIAMICNAERRIITKDEIRKICDYVINRQGYKSSTIIVLDNIMDLLEKLDFDNYTNNPTYKSLIKDIEDGRFNNTHGLYSPDENIIFYFYNNIKKHSEEGTELVQKEYSIDGSYYDIMNFFNFTCIIHELAHLRQNTILNNSRSSIEKKLFKLFINFNRSSNIYQNNYNVLPTEVNAENVAYINTYNIFSKLPDNFFSLSDRISYGLITLKRLLYANYQLYGKEDLVYGPTEIIANSLNNEILKPFNLDIDKYINLINDNNLTLYKKLMLGLPIDVSEYAYANLLVDELSSGLDINITNKLCKRLK